MIRVKYLNIWIVKCILLTLQWHRGSKNHWALVTLHLHRYCEHLRYSDRTPCAHWGFRICLVLFKASILPINVLQNLTISSPVSLLRLEDGVCVFSTYPFPKDLNRLCWILKRFFGICAPEIPFCFLPVTLKRLTLKFCFDSCYNYGDTVVPVNTINRFSISPNTVYDNKKNPKSYSLRFGQKYCICFSS